MLSTVATTSSSTRVSVMADNGISTLCSVARALATNSISPGAAATSYTASTRSTAVPAMAARDGPVALRSWSGGLLTGPRSSQARCRDVQVI